MRVIKLTNSTPPDEVRISALVDTGESTELVSYSPSHPNWAAARQAVADYHSVAITPEQLAEILYKNHSMADQVNDRLVTVSGVMDGRLRLENGRVTVDGEAIDTVLESHILRLLREDGTPKSNSNWTAFARFIENLYGNVSRHVREQLFGWLSYETLNGDGFTLTEDGCFIAYKGCAGTEDAPVSRFTGSAIVNGVRKTGHIPNPVGAVVEMARSAVEFNPQVGCAPGLHAGTMNYAKGWAAGVLLTVKVNPRDVVSVPTECDAQKIRTCRYTVLETTQHGYRSTTYYSTSAPTGDDSASTVSVNPDDVVSFDYVARDGHGGNYEVTVVSLDNDYLEAVNTDGERRTFLVRNISNMVNHTVPADAADTADVEDEVTNTSTPTNAGRGTAVTSGDVVVVRYRKRPHLPVTVYTITVTDDDGVYLSGDLTNGNGRRQFRWDRVVSWEFEDGESGTDSSNAGDSSQSLPPSTANPLSSFLADMVDQAARRAGWTDGLDPSDDDDPGSEEDEEIRRNGYGRSGW